MIGRVDSINQMQEPPAPSKVAEPELSVPEFMTRTSRPARSDTPQMQYLTNVFFWMLATFIAGIMVGMILGVML